MSTVYAQRNCAVGRSGGGLTNVRKGQAYDDGHELVRERPDLFDAEPPDAAGRAGAPAVERATRAPGETRRTPRRRK